MSEPIIVLTPDQLSEIIAQANKETAMLAIEAAVKLKLEEDEWLTRVEAAKLYKITPATFDKRRGEDDRIKTHYIGGSIRFKKSELMNLDFSEPHKD